MLGVKTSLRLLHAKIIFGMQPEPGLHPDASRCAQPGLCIPLAPRGSQWHPKPWGGEGSHRAHHLQPALAACPQPKCQPGARWAERATKGFVRTLKKPTKPRAGIIIARLQSNALGQKSCLLMIDKVSLI